MTDRLIVREAANPDSSHRGWAIFCPACDCTHLFDHRWEFNGNRDRPTFTGSMLVRWQDPAEQVCHSYVTDGRIQFLPDCTHKLAGQTVDLPAF